MRSLVPIFMSFATIVTTKTETIDFTDIGTSDEDHRTEIFSAQSDVNSANANDYPDYNTFTEYNQKATRDNERSDSRDWSLRETRVEADPLNSRKIVSLDNIDDDHYIDIDVDENVRSIAELNESDLNKLTSVLLKLLQQITWRAPIVIIDESPLSQESDELEVESSEETELRPNRGKRQRLFRPYPWKRQNPNLEFTYDYDTTYYCMPSRVDIYHLLVAIHDMRQSTRRRNVHFCNRRRTAQTLLTNVRFLGRRK